MSEHDAVWVTGGGGPSAPGQRITIEVGQYASRAVLLNLGPHGYFTSGTDFAKPADCV